MQRILLTSAISLVLSACSSESPPEAPVEEEVAPLATPETEPVSIIRPDIEEAVMIPLEPLAITIGFGDSGAELDDSAVEALEGLLATRQLLEGGDITIAGHSDAGGRDQANLRVSQQRADAVKDWLIDNGVAEDRISTIAFGEQNPVEPNALPDGTPNEEGRKANRRVDIRVDVPEGTMIEAAPSAVAIEAASED